MALDAEVICVTKVSAVCARVGTAARQRAASRARSAAEMRGCKYPNRISLNQG